jgi:uncharacterized membrane protein
MGGSPAVMVVRNRELCAGRDDQTAYEDLGVNAVTMAEIARL